MKKLRIFAVIIISIMIMLVCTGCVVRMPVPEVKEGRFDFSVTYEVNGEEKIYSGVYVCEYSGLYVTFVGRGRRWDGYIVGSNDWGTVAIKTTDDDCVIYIDFGFCPEYFMADPDYIAEKPQPRLFVRHINDEIDVPESEEEIFERYGVKIISYDYPEPIENSFDNKWSYGYFEPTIN